MQPLGYRPSYTPLPTILKSNAHRQATFGTNEQKPVTNEEKIEVLRSEAENRSGKDATGADQILADEFTNLADIIEATGKDPSQFTDQDYRRGQKQ